VYVGGYTNDIPQKNPHIDPCAARIETAGQGWQDEALSIVGQELLWKFTDIMHVPYQ
jgi:hypothetical protein